MSFSKDVVKKAWNRADGYCECRREKHGHDYIRCNEELVFKNRGREGRGAWKAHHKNSKEPVGLFIF